jgi:hypothetical protein
MQQKKRNGGDATDAHRETFSHQEIIWNIQAKIAAIYWLRRYFTKAMLDVSGELF